MSVGVEVDALALMLDGTSIGVVRFGDVNVRSLVVGGTHGVGGKEALMTSYAAAPEWAEVAEAILQLEAWADWFDSDYCASRPARLGDLAGRAKRAVKRMAHLQFEYLEAAALLRDGWRPKKRSKR